jgi:hypothetical protein
MELVRPARLRSCLLHHDIAHELPGYKGRKTGRGIVGMGVCVSSLKLDAKIQSNQYGSMFKIGEMWLFG